MNPMTILKGLGTAKAILNINKDDDASYHQPLNSNSFAHEKLSQKCGSAFEAILLYFADHALQHPVNSVSIKILLKFQNTWYLKIPICYK